MMNKQILNYTPCYEWALLKHNLFQSTYFGPAQQLWQVIVVNQKERAAVHTLWQQNK